MHRLGRSDCRNKDMAEYSIYRDLNFYACCSTISINCYYIQIQEVSFLGCNNNIYYYDVLSCSSASLLIRSSSLFVSLFDFDDGFLSHYVLFLHKILSGTFTTMSIRMYTPYINVRTAYILSSTNDTYVKHNKIEPFSIHSNYFLLL